MLLTRMRDAALPGYAKINVEQALRADVELWLRTANFRGHGVIRDRDGVLLMLCPLPSVASSKTARSGAHSGGTNGKRKLEAAEKQIVYMKRSKGCDVKGKAKGNDKTT